ncbi:MAG: hypothetical protein WKG03_09780 [Telluria sp.]
MANESGSNFQSDEQSGASSFPNGGSGSPHVNPGQQGWSASDSDESDSPNQGLFASKGGFADQMPPRRPASRFFGDTNEMGEFSSEESSGEEALIIGGGESTAAESFEFNQEVANPEGQESAEEFYEASPEQLAATESAEELGEEGLADILGGIVGGLFGETAELQEAGTGLELGAEAGQEEFFPFLAALVPTLVSAIGPSVAKKIVSRLSPQARQGVKRIAAGAKVVGKKSGKSGRNILGLFAKLLESAPDRAGSESGAEAGEEFNALIEEAVAAAEVIIGIDNRRLFTNTTAEPMRRICELRIRLPNGQTVRGTGFLIGARALATAGHCVYMHAFGGWARRVEVIPGANGKVRPYGSAISTSFRSVRGWVDGKKPECDYGCIVLPTGAFGGRNLGKFGFRPFDSRELLARTVYLKGYPGDKPSQLWGMYRRVKTVTAKTLIYDIDTVGGQSGAPVYLRLNRKRYVVGIHNYGHAGGNSATRVTPVVCERLKKWSMI